MTQSYDGLQRTLLKYPLDHFLIYFLLGPLLPLLDNLIVADPSHNLGSFDADSIEHVIDNILAYTLI